jgi:parvulin-like peptidyl-prolyl isomerase
MIRILSGAVILLTAGLLSCGQTEQYEPESKVVAIVGQDTIDVEAYGEMATKLLASSHRGKDPSSLDTRRQLLDAMIDRHLLVMEGQRRQLAASSRIATVLRQLQNQLVWRALFDAVAVDAGLDTSGLQTFVIEAGFTEEVLLQHVMLTNEADAWSVLEALDAGEPLDVLAVERSTHHETGSLGGYFSYMSVSQVLPEVKEQLLSLEPGQTYPAPLTSRYGVHVFRLIDRRPADIESRWDIVLKEFRVHERSRVFGIFADSLADANGLACESLAGDRSASDTLCTWAGGQLLPADVDLVEAAAEDDPQSWLRAKARKRLVVEEAKRRGMDRQLAVLDKVDARREEMMIDSLRRVVAGRIEVSDAEKRSYYEEHPELYGPRPSVRVDEVLVADLTLAQRLRGQAEAGAPIDSLARVHSIREVTKKRGGSMWLVTRDNPLLGPLAPLALDSEVGTLLGPLEVPGGYSVLRIAEKRQTPARPYEAVERNISTILRLRTEHQRMDALLVQLRVNFADEIAVHDDALGSLPTDWGNQKDDTRN